jgi:hypothetical protein
MSTIVEPRTFIEDLTRDIIAYPGGREEIMAGYASHLESMLAKARREIYDIQTI